jgi:Kef-type K+ transport system membrane component KefB
VAAAFVATSAGNKERVLQEMGGLHHIESLVILGAAVIDGILAMLPLWVVTGFHDSDVDAVNCSWCWFKLSGSLYSSGYPAHA